MTSSYTHIYIHIQEGNIAMPDYLNYTSSIFLEISHKQVALSKLTGSGGWKSTKIRILYRQAIQTLDLYQAQN